MRPLTSHGTGFARIFDDVSSKYELETRIRDMLDVGEGQLEAATEQRTRLADKSSADATQNGKRDSRAAALPNRHSSELLPPTLPKSTHVGVY